MTIELERWDAMIQLVRIEGLAKQDERGQQLLLQMVIEGVQDYHEEALPADLDSDLPEYLSLEEAQKNFAEFGAMSREFLEHVLPDGPSRFHRADESLDKQT